MKNCLLFIISAHFLAADAAKILASVSTPSYSHQIAFRPIWIELAKRGHEITLLTTDPIKDQDLPNLRQIDLSGSYKIMESFGASQLLSNRESKKAGIKEMLDSYIDALSATNNWQFEHPEVKALIQNRSTYFDLVMVEVMYPSHLAFVDRFKAHCIAIVSMDAPPFIHQANGNPIHPALNPDMVLPFLKDLTFKERLISAGVLVLMLWYNAFHIYPKEDASISRHFGQFEIRPLSSILNDMDMLFLNVNPIFNNIRASYPNTIHFGGGTHLKEPEALPKDIQGFLDSSPEGVIYFSLGSNVKSALISNTLKQSFLEAFRKLPYNILWKFEEDHMDNKPDNVKIIKWSPQQDVFMHPKVKAFITQGGFQSIEEAIHFNIPMIVIPFFGDQNINAKILEEKGFGKRLNKDNLTSSDLIEALEEVINNVTYKNNIKEAADILNDFEMSGLQKAVWWTEYVLRNKGAQHLRNPLSRLPLYQYFMLDVMAFVLVFVVLFSFMVIKCCKVLSKPFYKIKKE